MATISSSKAPPGDKTRFELWPLPDLRLSSQGAVVLEDAADAHVPPTDYERGYADGVASADRNAEERVGDACRALSAVRKRLEEMQRRQEGETERAVHALAIAVAEQVLQREISIDSDIVGNLVRKAIDDVGSVSDLTVRLHPEDLVVVQEYPEWNEGESSSIEWIGDPKITRGGCLVESSERLVDGRIEAALKELFQRLSYV